MTDEEKREKVIRGLECCLSPNDHENCPYDGIGKTYSHCLKQLVTDAFALIKEQEARVMTLEEAREALHNEDFVHFIEDIDEEMLVGFRAGQDYLSLSNGNYMNLDDLDEGGDLATEYGKTFRFWTSRPSEQQMRDTKWEEEDDG